MQVQIRRDLVYNGSHEKPTQSNEYKVQSNFGLKMSKYSVQNKEVNGPTILNCLYFINIMLL